MNKRVDIIMANGERLRGHATTDHPSSSYGRPIILIGNIPHGPGDVAMVGAKIIVGDPDVASALTEVGFDASVPQAKVVSAKLPGDLHARLLAHAQAKDTTISSAIASALEAWIDEID